MRAVRTLLTNLLVTAVLVAAALCFAAAVAAQGGRFRGSLDVLAHFALMYLGVGTAALTLSLVSPRWGRRPLLAAGLVTVVASGVLIAPELMRDTGPKAASNAPGQLKIIQFNVLRTNTDMPRVVDWIVAQHPDIVTTQETPHALRDALVARTGWQAAGAAGDLMIFSRERRIGMDRPQVPQNLLHWVNATYPSPSGPYEVVTVHLDWPLGPDQRRQWVDLARVIHQLPTNRMIVTGDFNATPWAFTMQHGDAGVGLPRRDRALASFPAKWNADGPVRSPVPLLPIDHVYAGPGWATVKVERGPRGLGSDHYPVIVTLAPLAPR